MKGAFYETKDVMRLLGDVGHTTACKYMRKWKAEIEALGFHAGTKGLISKAYVDSKLFSSEDKTHRSGTL